MFTEDGMSEYEKYAKWIGDDSFQFSPDFVPGPDTPPEVTECYK